MAINLNIEGVKRGDLFFVPLKQVILDAAKNTRFAPPSREELDDMKESLRTNGQMVPAEVVLTADKTQVRVIDGTQRTTLLMELEKEEGKERMLKCVLFKGNEQEGVRRSIEINLKRADCTPMDDAKNIRTLMDDYGDSVESVAKLYRKSPAWVTSKRLPLLALPYEIQVKVHSGELGAETALTLANLPVSDDERVAVLNDAIEENKAKTPAPEPPVAPNENGPKSDPGKGGKKKKKGKKETVSNTDVLRHAERRNAMNPEQAPARKMSEVVKFFKELIETSPDGSYASLFAKDFMRWRDRKLKDETFENKIYEYTHTKLGTVISDGKGGKRK